MQCYYSWYELDSSCNRILLSKNLTYNHVFAPTNYVSNCDLIASFPVVGFLVGFAPKGNKLFFSSEFIYTCHPDSNRLYFYKSSTDYCWWYDLDIDSFNIY